MSVSAIKPRSGAWLVSWGETPLGRIDLTFTEHGLCSLEFSEGGATVRSGSDSPPPSLGPVMEVTQKELADYFAGIHTDFLALPLDIRGTPFQLRVWRALGAIPWGRVISYRELAARLGNPPAARAVGQALGANPIPIIIPCHRVIAADGSLGGFRGGLDRKRWLLRHEGEG